MIWKKVKKNLYLFFHALFIVSFSFVLLIVFCLKKNMNERLFMILFSFLLIVTLLFLFYFFDRYKERINKFSTKHLLILFIIYFIIQICVSISLAVKPSWDFGSVYKEAIYLTENNTWNISNTHYFLMYPNNQFYLIILTMVFKFFASFGCTYYIFEGIVFNAVLVDISLYVFFLCLKKLYSQYIAYFGLILSFLCCVFITYIPIFYTDTFPMLFMNFALLGYLLLSRTKDIKFFCLLSVFIGVNLFIGFELKATVAIMLVAFVIHALFTMKFRKFLIISICTICTFFGCLVSYNHVFQKSEILNMNEYDLYNFPYTHWVMMGLRTPGGYNEIDFNYTKSFKTIDDKKQAHLSEIEKRIANKGLSGMINHIKYKIDFTWNDGTYFSQELLARKPIYNELVTSEYYRNDGKYISIHKKLSNGLHYAVIFFMLLSSLNALNKIKKNESMDFVSCLRLSVFGLFTFLLIWETKSKYLVNFIPIIYFIAIDGINYVYNCLKREEKIKCIN